MRFERVHQAASAFASRVFWVYGIRKDVKVDTVRITDLAPTVAEIMGFKCRMWRLDRCVKS
jgi:hypothetical protein